MQIPENTNRSGKQLLRLCSAILSVTMTGVGCQSPGTIATDPRTNADARADLRASLPIFNGSGRARTWSEVMNAAAEADVIIIGEQHDDAVGHAVQLAFFEDAAARWPDTMLSLEMLDRRRQSTVDDYVAGIINKEKFLHEISSVKYRKLTSDYLDGEIDRKTFRKKIFSLSWPDWINNYQPIIDVAKENELHVIAANTPWARYASLANRHGLERLESLTPAQRRLVESPEFLPEGKYRERFDKVMSHMNDDSGDGNNHGQPKNNTAIDGMYRAQCVMDATMADSIADTMARRPGKVVHLVGQFHSDFDGGIVLQLKRMRPHARILTLSMQAEVESALRDEDAGRADFVIYTGKRKLDDG